MCTPMLNTLRCQRASLGLVAICVLALTNNTFAATLWTVDMTGGGAHDWNAGSTWDGTTVDTVDALDGTVPLAGDIAIVQRGDENNDYVYIDSATQISRFGIGTSSGETGALEIRSGGSLTSSSTGRSDAGNAGTGFIRIQNGGLLDMAGELIVGNSGTSTGNVLIEGTMNTAQYFNMGNGSGNTGTVVVNGGTNTIGQYLQVGRLGNGSYSIINGTVNVNRVSSGSGLVVASGSNSTGLLEISGNSSLTVSADNAGMTNGVAAGTGAGTIRVIGDGSTFTVGTNYIQHPGATLEFDIASAITSIDMGGNITLAGALDVEFTTTPTIGDSFTLMNYGGTLSTTFDTTSVTGLPAGSWYALDYGTGANSSVVLSVVVPEPTTMMSLSLGLVVLAFRRRR